MRILFSETVLLLVLGLFMGVHSLEAEVSVDPDTVGADSSFIIQVMFDESLGRGGIVSVQIPDDNLTSSTLNRGLTFRSANADSSLSCTQLTRAPPKLSHCTYQNMKHIKIYLSNEQFILAGQTIKIRVENASKNPSSLWWKDKSLKVSTYTLESPVQVESRSDFVLLSSLSPAALTMLSQPLLSSSEIGKPSQSITLSFQAYSAIPANGSILVVFPCRFKTSTQIFWYLNANFTITTFKVNGIDNVSQVSHQITNVYDGSTKLSIKAAKDLPASASFEVALSEFNNPIEQGHRVVIQTFDNLGAQMDQSSGSDLLVAQTPATISGAAAKASLDSGSRKVNQSSGIKLELTSPIPFPKGCLLRVGIPTASKTALKESLRYIYAYGMFGQIRSLPFKFVNDSLIEVEDACNTHAPLNDKAAALKLKYLRNPDTVRATESFSFSVYDSSRRLLLQTEASDSLKIAASEFSPADLSAAQILPQNQTIKEKNDLIFRLTLTNALDAKRNAQINISIPEDFQLLDQCTFTGLSAGLVSTKSCAVDVNGRTVQIRIRGQDTQQLDFDHLQGVWSCCQSSEPAKVGRGHWRLRRKDHDGRTARRPRQSLQSLQHCCRKPLCSKHGVHSQPERLRESLDAAQLHDLARIGLWLSHFN